MSGRIQPEFRLLDTTRSYIIEKLGESGELDAVASRHADYFRDLFERAEAERETRPMDRMVARLRASDRQPSRRPGLVLRTRRRQRGRRGADRRGNSVVVASVAVARVPYPLEQALNILRSEARTTLFAK